MDDHTSHMAGDGRWPSPPRHAVEMESGVGNMVAKAVVVAGVAVAVLVGAAGVVDLMTWPTPQPVAVQAVSPMSRAADQVQDVLAYQESSRLNQAARDSLSTALSSAQTTYDASAGKVDDDQVRVTLKSAINQATVALESAPGPGSPGPGSPDSDDSSDPTAIKSEPTATAASTAPSSSSDTTLDQCELDAQTITLQALTDQLAAAEQAVCSAQAAWQTEQAEKAQYTGENGRLDPATLCSVPYDQKQLLRCDAEAAWMVLDAAYKQVWDEDIPLDLTYRTYDEQVEMKAIYGSGAAVPGTSNHGWGTAVDLPDWREGGLGLEWDYGMPKYEWMKANAPAFDWVNPSWAVQGGRGPAEPWHFEYVG